jgi:hypothetical protein
LDRSGDLPHRIFESGPDNLPGKIAKNGLVIRIDSVTDIDIETGMAP